MHHQVQEGTERVAFGLCVELQFDEDMRVDYTVNA